MHFSILLCHASMHCWKDSSGMPLSSVVTALLMASTPSKRIPLMLPLSLGKRKKSHGARSGKIGMLFQYSDVLLGQELPVVSRCIVVVKQPRFILPQLSSFLAHWAKQKPQDLFVDLLIDRLALWQELTVDDASDIEERDQHDFDFWFWLSCLLRPRRRRRLPLTSLALGFRVVIKNPCLTPNDDSTKQVWFSLKTLDDVLTHLQAALLLIIIQQPWHHFCADFPQWEEV